MRSTLATRARVVSVAGAELGDYLCEALAKVVEFKPRLDENSVWDDQLLAQQLQTLGADSILVSR
jgi:hypothetical protein